MPENKNEQEYQLTSWGQTAFLLNKAAEKIWFPKNKNLEDIEDYSSIPCPSETELIQALNDANTAYNMIIDKLELLKRNGSYTPEQKKKLERHIRQRIAKAQKIINDLLIMMKICKYYSQTDVIEFQRMKKEFLALPPKIIETRKYTKDEKEIREQLNDVILQNPCGFSDLSTYFADEQFKSKFKDIIEFWEWPSFKKAEWLKISHNYLIRGPRGSGKTHLAEALAGELQKRTANITLLHVRIGNILAKFGERRLPQVIKLLFQIAEDYTRGGMYPVILFIDEIETLLFLNREISYFDIALREILNQMDNPPNKELSKSVIVIVSYVEIDPQRLSVQSKYFLEQLTQRFIPVTITPPNATVIRQVILSKIKEIGLHNFNLFRVDIDRTEAINPNIAELETLPTRNPADIKMEILRNIEASEYDTIDIISYLLANRSEEEKYYIGDIVNRLFPYMVAKAGKRASLFALQRVDPYRIADDLQVWILDTRPQKVKKIENGRCVIETKEEGFSMTPIDFIDSSGTWYSDKILLERFGPEFITERFSSLFVFINKERKSLVDPKNHLRLLITKRTFIKSTQSRSPPDIQYRPFLIQPTSTSNVETLCQEIHGLRCGYNLSLFSDASNDSYLIKKLENWYSYVGPISQITTFDFLEAIGALESPPPLE